MIRKKDSRDINKNILKSKKKTPAIIANITKAD